MLVAETFKKGTVMSFTDLAAFDQVVALVQAGQRQEAYVQVKALAKMDPTNTNLLLWLAFTTPDLNQAEMAINKVVVLNPFHPSIASAWEWLASERLKQQTQHRPIVVSVPMAEQPQVNFVVSAPPPAPPAPQLAHPAELKMATAEGRQTGQIRVKGNIKTKVYHMPDGAFYAQMKRGNVEYFNSEAEAQAAGYRRSKT